MILNKPQCNGVYLCTIVQERHAVPSINPYPGYIFDPIPSIEGIEIQEGILCTMFYTFGIPPWGAFSVVIFLGGVQAPFVSVILSFWFKCELVLDATTNGQAQMKWSRLLQ